MSEEIVIVSAKRTAIGGFNGTLSGFTGRDLASFVIKAILKDVDEKTNHNFKSEMIDYAKFGSCMERCDQLNVGRVACLDAGLPNTVCASTINQVCTSAMQALIDSVFLLRGNSDMNIILVGGVESMSNTTFQVFEARRGCGYGNRTFVDSLNLGLHAGGKIIMGLTAENLAEKYKITREEQDEVALRSHNNAEKATKEGLFKNEIVPISIPQRKKDPIIFDKDEHFRPGLTMEQLERLRPAFKKDGTVTAGNASGINDGAAAVLLMKKSKAEELNLKPLGTFVNWGIGGCDPDYMGESPVPAVKQVLNRTKMSLSDIEIIELNEAFAAQYLACEKQLLLNRDTTNVVGSGIGLGHPVGCTGIRLIVTLLHQMERRNLKFGMATLCGGGGIGTATIWEKK
ncbi:MAG: acetyl-CoA C-acyltransferase [Candidatus Lokiarchaeota archaeon]|nr:acetyl-CoA C-acyltransferase [Candidatus Lokiarchaeota archaeon]